MKKYKNKFKKILYKTIPCVVVFSLLFSFALIPKAVEVDYITNAKFNSLSDIFTGVTSGGWVYDDVNTPPINFTSPYIRSLSRPVGGNTRFEIVGDFNLNNIFSRDLYYTITVPLTWYWPNQSAAFVYLSLIDNNGNSFDFSYTLIRPDPLAASNATATYIQELNISGKNLQEISKFKITAIGNQWSDDLPYVRIGLLDTRFITISSMTQYEYESLYGGSTEPIAPDAEENIAHFESVEDDLYIQSNVDGVKVFFENLENAELYTPLQSASMLFSELYNFGGVTTTIFESISIFSLALGLVVLLIAIAPRLVSGGRKK